MNRKIAFFSTAAMAAVGLAFAAQSAGAQQSLAGGQSYSGDALEIENFIGVIEIREGSGPITVAMTNSGGHVEDPTISETGDGVRIDGGQQRLRRINCQTRNDRMRVGRRGDMHDIEDYPRLVITAPADVSLDLGDSVYRATAGDLGALDLGVRSCGDFEGGDVSGDANIGVAGSGDVRLGTIGGDAAISIAGQGDVATGRVSGAGDISITGWGDVQVNDFGGDVAISIAGSGDVRTGDISGLAVRVTGSGDVTAGEMNGAFDASISGSGDIRVAGGLAQPFSANINGAGDIRFGGVAVDVRVNENGSGDVEIADLEGSIKWRRHGRTVLRAGSD